MNIIKLAEEIVNEGTGTQDVLVIRAKRLPSKTDKPGIMKIELCSLQEKICVLRNKQKLKDHRVFNRVFIRTSKTHAERLLEGNLSVLLPRNPEL